MNNEKQQIEEMVKIIDGSLMSVLGARLNDDILVRLAEYHYNAGYRKQSEGEWKPYKDYFTEIQIGWICSKCSAVSYDLSNGDTDFCPNCGARMKGGVQE